MRTLKKVDSDDLKIYGSKLFTKDDVIANSSLKLPLPLLFIQTNYIEQELRKNLVLKDVSVYKQVLPFGLKIIIKTRIPIAYGETIVRGEKKSGYIDKDGFFISEKIFNKTSFGNLTCTVFGWNENAKKRLSKIFNSRDTNMECVRIDFSPNGFLTIEEKFLKTILLGFNPEIIERQLEIIKSLKNELTSNQIQKKIDSIDLTDPNNPKIKVFKP